MKTTTITYKGFFLDIYYEIELEEKETLYTPRIEREISVLEIWINGSNMIDLLYYNINDIVKELEKHLTDNL